MTIPASDSCSVEAPTRRGALLQSDASIEPESSYREILGNKEWHKLKPEIRKRFSIRPGKGSVIRYHGMMHTVYLSFMGWLFAQACRLIGMPLAPYCGKDVPMEILLLPEEHGMAWIRVYKFKSPGTIAVRSTKKRGKANDLVEHIGCGFSMSLVMDVRGGDLFFVSRAYNLKLANIEIQIPDILTPGQTTVSHEQLEGNRFRFSLDVVHPIFGRTIFQEGEFE